MMSPHAAGAGLSQGRRNAVEFSVGHMEPPLRKHVCF